jgi:hypothetical protein
MNDAVAHITHTPAAGERKILPASTLPGGRTIRQAAMGRRNLAKPFAIAGFVARRNLHVLRRDRAVSYRRSDSGSALAWKVVFSAIFFGPFGALIGTGVGLLVSAFLPKK